MAIDVETVLRFSSDLQRAVTVHDLLLATRAAIRLATPYRNVWLAVIHPGTPRMVEILAISGEESVEQTIMQRAPAFPVDGDAFLEEICSASRPVVVVDARTDPRTDKAMVDRIGNRTIINVPLLIGDQRLGAMGVGTFHPEPPLGPTPEHLELLVVFATQLSAAFQRVQMLETQRALQLQLQASQRIEGLALLAGGVAHDFNNLLTVILSCAETLKAGEAGASPEPEVVDEILGAGRRAALLTRQLLAFARKQVIAPVPLDLNEVVRRNESLAKRVLGENIELVCTLDPALCTVRCDPGQIEQVLLNLAINARDAMPAGGRLTIQTGNARLEPRDVATHRFLRPGEYARLRVSDTGEGLTPDAQAHAFEPFFTTKAKGKGTGLGLATVYGIVKQNHGYILLDSEVGRGASFEVYLPRVSEAPVAIAVPGPSRRSGTEAILLVEDDQQVREVTLRSLVAAGYRVTVAANGQEALEVAERHEGALDLLLTDIVMPGLNGRELAEELCRSRPDLRVLYMSGYSHDVISQAGVLDSGIEFLAKPFTAAILQDRVRQVLDAGWTEAMRTGIADVDTQHREILENIALLAEAGRVGNLEEALDIMSFIQGFIGDHFTAEEQYMKAAGYPGLAEHRGLHRALLGEFRRREEDFVAKGLPASGVAEMSAWLDAWIHEHVRGADTRMAAHLRGTTPA